MRHAGARKIYTANTAQKLYFFENSLQSTLRGMPPALFNKEARCKTAHSGRQAMNKPTAWIALAFGAFDIALLVGCSTEKETTYVPTQPQVVVQPAPVVVSPPVTTTTTTSKTVSSSQPGANSTEESTSYYKSESTTITPVTRAPESGSEATTYQKKTYQSSNY
jgi:hypothetical protein